MEMHCRFVLDTVYFPFVICFCCYLSVHETVLELPVIGTQVQFQLYNGKVFECLTSKSLVIVLCVSEYKCITAEKNFGY